MLLNWKNPSKKMYFYSERSVIKEDNVIKSRLRDETEINIRVPFDSLNETL